MKSLYLNDTLHNQLKLVATFEKKSLTSLVEEFLNKMLKKKTSDLPTEMITKLSEIGGSFDFLKRPEEGIYTLNDGIEVL